MNLLTFVVGLWAIGSLRAVRGNSPTDSLMDGDSAQSGYLPNHNMDPTVITGGAFGQLWQYKGVIPTGGAPDQFYAKPLVYSPARLGGQQLVLAFSEANRIYVVDAVNGTLVAKRDLALEGEGPFKVTDLPSCNDIGGWIGITGTPVIDPTTDTVYFWAKSYLPGGQTGWVNGAYNFHAVDAVTLVERPGFPTNIQGFPADNDVTRRFTGGTHLQRTGLNLINGAVYAGFGGHCDLFNYTGWVVGISTAGNFLTAYSTNAGPHSPPQDGTWVGGGGGAGVWQAGAAIASDNSGRLFFATGNAKGGGQNNQLTASGRVHLDVLSESMVNLAIDPGNGSLTQADYFEPFGYLAMDAGDRDLGSGGVCLPDAATFSGGGIARLAITCGKNGICYVTNADNLGGYKTGVAGGDGIVQTFSPPGGGAVFSNVGSYPLEGGYIYVTPVGAPTYVYSLGADTSGRPTFTLVAQTAELAPGAVGVGPATITSFNGKAGTGILWIVDTNGIRAYNAAPVGGKMTRITLPAVINPSKFQRPTFGNGRYYMATLSGAIVGFGAPVALPLNCSSPVDFGSVAIGAISTMSITCTANIAISQILGLTVGKTFYQASNASLPQTALNAGDIFSFPVTFNLTNYVLSAGSTSAPTVSPGVQTTALNLYTTNTVAGYSTQQGITLTGAVISPNPFLAVNPLQVGFAGIVIGSAISASSGTFNIQNAGQTPLTILGYAYGLDAGVYTANVTLGGAAVLDGNGYFTSSGLPALNTNIAPGGSLTVDASFQASVVGDFFTLLTIFSDGGASYVILTGSANTAPVVNFDYSTAEGGWNPIPDCAIPADGCTYQVDIGTLARTGTILKTIRFSNVGGSNLLVTKSKPPIGTVLGATNPSTDLSEGLTIPPTTSATATIYFQPGSLPLNADPIVYFGAWTLNTDDLTFGVHVMNFTGTLAPKQVGPTLASGKARYKYLGCYQDAQGARLEATQFNSVVMENGLCQNKALTANAVFAGTEFQSQCFYGSAIPAGTLKVDDSKCTSYTCAGDITQLCGGFGTFISIYYDSLRYDPVLGVFLTPPPSSSTVAASVVASTVVPVPSSTVAPVISSVATATPTGPIIPPTIGNFAYTECRSDNLTIRTLSGKRTSVPLMTLDLCATTCAAFNYFGVEFGNECYCGNTVSFGSFTAVDGRCSMACGGNATEICGGPKGLTMYTLQPPVVVSSSSVVAPVSSSVVAPVSSSVVAPPVSSIVDTALVSPSVVAPPVSSIVDTALVSSSVVAPPVSSIVDTALVSSSVVAPPVSSIVVAPVSTPVPSTLVSSVISTPLASSSVPAATPSLPPWSYVGCANDTTAHRALNGTNTAAATMTRATCQAYCLSKNYPLAGVEFGTECFCGLDFAFGSKIGQTGCTKVCGGNASETCGGSSRLDVMKYNPYVYPVLAPTVGTYKLQGCYIDATNSRAVTGFSFTSSTTMTVDLCVSTCSAKGYVKAGVEFGSQCFCGATVAATATVAAMDDCKAMFCGGNKTEYCGAGSRILVYSSV